MKGFFDANFAALIISLLLIELVMRENKKLRQRCERLEGANSVLQDALLARTQQVRKLERESVPIVQVPTNEDINRWLQRAGR